MRREDKIQRDEERRREEMRYHKTFQYFNQAHIHAKRERERERSRDMNEEGSFNKYTIMKLTQTIEYTIEI